MSVILNEVKNLVESMGWKTEILRLMPQNDIATQSPRGGEVIFYAIPMKKIRDLGQNRFGHLKFEIGICLGFGI